MNSRRNPFLVIFSLLCGIVVAALFLIESGAAFYAAPGEQAAGAGGNWALLSFDENEDEKPIAEALKAGGFEDFFCETNQDVYLDDFGSLKTVSLESYPNLVEAFDPRNDGYAEKLKSLFVRNGRRYFFVFIEETFFPRNAEKNLDRALGEFSYEAEFPGTERRRILPNFLAGAAAVFLGFLVCRKKRLYAPYLPLLLAFACTGPLGLILAALLMGLAGLVNGFLGEFFPSRSYASLGKRLSPYRPHFLLCLVFILLFCLLCYVDGAPLLSAGTGLFLLFPLVLFSFKDERKNAPLARFEPVWILPGRAEIPPLRLQLFPFAAASAALLLLPVFYPQTASSIETLPFVVEDFVSPEDYEEHIAFQLSFSGKSLAHDDGAYLRYYLGEDGLIAGSVPETIFRDTAGSDPPENIPPFPLEKVRAFLVQYKERAASVPPAQIEWIPVVLLLIICVPGRYPKRGGYTGRKKTVFFRDKRIAA